MRPERSLCFLFFLIISFEQIVGPPAVIKKHDDDKDHAVKTNEVEPDNLLDDADFDIEYKRYLQEVVKVLETDEEFKKKVENTPRENDEFDTGKLAKELDMVNHHVRTKLDELKRQEVQRLRDIVKRKMDLGHGPLHPSEYEHIDHLNLETFEVKDLDNLLKKVSKDMEKLDEMRKQQFKQYEMEKRFEEELKMSNMTDTEKDEHKKHLEEMKKKHANHEKIHHPGSKAQMEEVWEKQDQLSQEFDPKIFFHLHDIDGNGYWDPEEVKVLFIKELDKMYQAGLPEDDMRERQEEMERMREHVFKEMDKNRDNLISFQEYMDETKTREYNQDEGWDTLDKQQVYSREEYNEFERRRMAEIQHMIDQGLIPPERYPGMAHMNNQAYQYHPNQVPQYHANQMPPQGYHPNQAPQHPNQYPNQAAPQQQYQQNQPAYHQNQHPNQIPQQGYHPNPPADYHPAAGQPVQNNQQQYHNNQPPPQQYQPNQNSQHQYQDNSKNNQQQYQQGQNSQQQYQQVNNQQQQHQQVNNQQQQQHQVNNQQQQQQQQQQYQQNNQQQYQQGNPPQQQYQQNNQQQYDSSKNNQQQYQQSNQNNQQQYQKNQNSQDHPAAQPSNIQPPASNH